ncbi:hypothetical protein CBM2633_A70410 [Cupriavidus taiwanensis]|nr:hypothetical protein CBM2626_A140106 [Cupriavidus taiwanensis]SPA16452.1 hypothetical protein CBM2633_A70410 [Cupriavidus taiwanensis]
MLKAGRPNRYLTRDCADPSGRLSLRLKQAVEAAAAPGAADMLPVCRFSRPAAGTSGKAAATRHMGPQTMPSFWCKGLIR